MSENMLSRLRQMLTPGSITRSDILDTARETLIDVCRDYRRATGDRMTDDEVRDIAGGILDAANADASRFGYAAFRLNEVLMSVIPSVSTTTGKRNE